MIFIRLLIIIIFFEADSKHYICFSLIIHIKIINVNKFRFSYIKDVFYKNNKLNSYKRSYTVRK